MKKTGLRFLAFMLLIAMLGAVVSGCGDSAASEAMSSQAETAVPTEQAESEIPAAPEAPAAPASSTVESESPPASEVTEYNPRLVDESATLTFWHNTNDQTFSVIDNFSQHEGYKLAEEITGVTIEHVLVSAQAQSEQFNLMIASGDYSDMIENFSPMYTGGAVAAYSEGVIIDFAEIVEKSAPNYWKWTHTDEETTKAVYTDDGQMLSFYTIYRDYMEGPTSGMVIRKDWLDKLGMDTPQTYDELHDVLTAFKTDLGADTPLYITSSGAFENAALQAGYGITAYLNTEGDGVVYPFFQEDGVIKFGPSEPGFVEYITMMNQWKQEGLIANDFSTASGNPMDSAFSSKVLANQTGLFNIPAMLIDTFESMAEDPDFTLAAISDVGKTPDATFDVGFRTRNYSTAGISISTACEDPELAVRWVDFFYSDQGSLIATYGVEGESYTLDDNGNPQFTDIIMNDPNGRTPMTMTSKYVVNVNSLQESFVSKTLQMSDAATAASAIWAKGKTGLGELPKGMSMTLEETETFNSYWSDICTYCQSMIAMFISGDEPLENVEAFQQQLIDMGIEECIACEQAALDRYNER